jgi:hypothetical protein
MIDRIKFVNWDYRPAILVGDEAFAVLRPGTPWVSADRKDVFHTSAVMSEDHWRKTFVREGFGRLEVCPRWRLMTQDNNPQPRPLSRRKDFDDAARAAVAAHAAHLAATSLPEIEAPPIAPAD